MDCFDSDVLIYAVIASHPLGRRVRSLIDSGEREVCAGSVLLMPEVMSKPSREGGTEAESLRSLLSKLHLHPVDRVIAEVATALGAKYRLRAPDAIHLATAVSVGADRFITNNRRDFDKGIAEVDVVFPEALPEPG